MVFYEVFEEERQAMERHLPEGLDAAFFRETVQESGHERAPAPFVSIRTQSVMPVEWVSQIRAVLTRSTGYDHVLSFLDAARADIPAGYLPSYCSRAVAEHALMMWISLMRRLPVQTERFRRFERDGLTGLECLGKTLAVVGVGSIGTEVCRIGGALGMEVLGVDIVKRHPSISYVTPHMAVENAHVIVCSMDLTDANRGYFSRGLLGRARRRPVFINVARGEFVDAADLLGLLEEGILSGVGLDVYADEGALAQALRSGAAPGGGPARSLLEMSRRTDVLFTPHNAFNTAESVDRKARQSVSQALHFLSHSTFVWNVPR
jgi:D-lactate dehydrogenase